MNEELKIWLWNEFKFTTLPKYYKYFEEWIKNLTETQVSYYLAYSKSKKTPYDK